MSKYRTVCYLMYEINCGMQPLNLNNKELPYYIYIYIYIYRVHKSRTTPQNKVRLKVLPEQLTLFVNTSVTLKKCKI